MTYAWPGPISSSEPSSCVMCIVPLWTTPTCRIWQLSVPATGLMHSDQRQPGSSSRRAALVSPMRTMSTRVRAGVRVSSGDAKLRASMLGIALLSLTDPYLVSGPDAEIDLELTHVDRNSRSGRLSGIHRAEGAVSSLHVLL